LQFVIVATVARAAAATAGVRKLAAMSMMLTKKRHAIISHQAGGQRLGANIFCRAPRATGGQAETASSQPAARSKSAGNNQQ
jgi:hypothetical protein